LKYGKWLADLLAPEFVRRGWPWKRAYAEAPLPPACVLPGGGGRRDAGRGDPHRGSGQNGTHRQGYRRLHPAPVRRTRQGRRAAPRGRPAGGARRLPHADVDDARAGPAREGGAQHLGVVTLLPSGEKQLAHAAIVTVAVGVVA